MNYRRLGTTNLEVSEIAFGCMSLQATDLKAGEIIAQALDYGINLFDTADLYEFGQNEELLGRSLVGKRHKVILATKVGNEWTTARDGWTWNPTKNYILKAVEGSLKRLKTDYIDLYQLHGGTLDDPIDESLEAFELLKEQGKIREYGISSIRPNVIRQYVKRSNIASVMMQYSLLDRRPEEEVLGLLKENNVSIIARGTLAKGFLVDKPASEYLGHSEANIRKACNKIQELSQACRVSRASVAAGFVLAKQPVASATVGFRTLKQLNDLQYVFNGFSLTAPERAELALTLEALHYDHHR